MTASPLNQIVLLSMMLCTLSIVRYPRWLGWAGFLSMAVFRLPLAFSKKHSFWKLMGCGRNGTFDIVPDLRQWGLLEIWKPEDTTSSQTPVFIRSWWRFFRCEVWSLQLKPIEGHGTWDGKEVFGPLPRQTSYEGITATLTRATIRLYALKKFWKQVDGIASRMNSSDGFITSVGIGEVPWVKQATFSIWESKEHMKQFAYSMKEHARVVRTTREENWYSEDMFVRFKPLASLGTIRGKNPLEEKL